MSEISEEDWKRDLTIILEDLSSAQFIKMKECLRGFLQVLKDGLSREEMPGTIIEFYGKEKSILEMERVMEEIPKRKSLVQHLLKPYVQKVRSKLEKQQHEKKRRRKKEPEEGTSPAADQLEGSQPVKKPKTRDSQDGKAPWDGQYELNSQPTGLCLIINNKHFSGGDVRRGTDKDAGSLAEVFSWLGFRVLMCKDQTKNQMERVLKCFASQCDLSQLQEFNVQEWTRSEFTDLLEAPQHGDAFICCVLSHGNKGGVSGTDGQSLRIKQITRTFIATPQSPLTAKPKVFLIQACQGRQIHPGVLSDDLQADDSHSTQPADDSHSTSIPQEADILVHSSTVEEYISVRDPTKGSWFIQSVCEQLKEGCQRNEEIEVILRRVNYEVAGKEGVLRRGPVKQMPAIWHTLRKGLVLTPHQNSAATSKPADSGAVPRKKKPAAEVSGGSGETQIMIDTTLKLALNPQAPEKPKTRDSQDGKAPWVNLIS
ncbi:LOW QUALITY PROTEIN: caspase-8-like [Gymnodraco acuticeps]|uniref:LOW QUALITY PROTEIN: caspase-8-like n=1 Tax=Gymnodraco acuticeps TaxID=8218 RepID=A0A6P8V462_GYMAC|nr:LOW QUALITY PROTEIN: caspase-8-like [Gymnodraco acuticeps]